MFEEFNMTREIYIYIYLTRCGTKAIINTLTGRNIQQKHKERNDDQVYLWYRDGPKDSKDAKTMQFKIAGCLTMKFMIRLSVGNGIRFTRKQVVA